ncbi:MAG: S8 family serine peptidase [Cyclobacteriaceae bacterium]
MSKVILIVVAIFCAFASVAQDRYMVFFANKSDQNYPYSLDMPNEFLTERAIQRRASQGIAIDSTDMPVNPAYVDSLKVLGIDVYFTSRWINGALIQTDESDIQSIQALAFVDSIALIANKAKLSTDKIAFETPTNFDEPSSVSSSTEMQNAMLQVDVMHQDGIRGEGMVIAVLDNGFTGVDESSSFEHLWTENKILAQRDFVENSGNVFRMGDHGTSVFSTIAAKYEEDFVGVAYNANFILCLTEEVGSEDRVEEYNWLLGAEFADSLGADVINGSLGYNTFDIAEHNYEYEDLDGETTVVSVAAKMASEKGMIVVVSAGNNGDNPPSAWRYITPPADAKDILTVGSVNPDFTWTPFSSLGPASDGTIKPDVSALGLKTAIIRGNGSITSGNGTSFASPQIAGLAAGIWQANPDWTNLEVINAMKAASHQAHRPDTLVGHGVPFYSYAVDGKVLNITDILTEKITVYPNPFQGEKLFLKIDTELNHPLAVEIVNSEGKSIFLDTVTTSDASAIVAFELKDIQEGLYFLSLQYADEKKVVKLIHFQ